MDTLEHLFTESNSLFNKLSSGCSADDDLRIRAIQVTEETISEVNKHGLMSKNEELDDYSTNSIKYLYLEYYLAVALSKCVDMESRLASLKAAKNHMSNFLETCTLLGILHEDEAKFVADYSENRVSADMRRRMKIEKYKRRKANKERFESLQRLLLITKDDVDIDHEEEARETAILQLKMYAQDCIDEIELLDAEIQMLEHRNTIADSASSSGPQSAEGVDKQKPPAPGQGPGIEVMRLSRLGGEVVSTRETVRGTVFRERIAPPTMTLEEFADKELADARAREEREREAQGSDSAGRRYNQLVADGDEDIAQLVDEATMKDREWDDWKDENPRGIGNKMGKRF